MPGNAAQNVRSRSSVGNGVQSFVGIVGWFAPHGGMARDSVGDIESENLVSTFRAAILVHVFPFFFIGILLRLGPGRARGKIKRVRVHRPTKSMDVLFPKCDWKSLSAIGRN